jgi:hypothetical protein
MAKSSKQRESAPPVFTRKVFTGTGNVEVAVWEREHEDRKVFSVTVRRTWMRSVQDKD